MKPCALYGAILRHSSITRARNPGSMCQRSTGASVAPRRADFAEADDAGDVLAAQCRVDHRQGEQDVLAGVGGAVLLEDQPGRHAACHHALLDHGAFGARKALRRAAAHDGVAKQTALPQIDGGGDRLADTVAAAEHEQQVGRPEWRRDQVLGVDPRDLGRSFNSGTRRSRGDCPLPARSGSGWSHC